MVPRPSSPSPLAKGPRKSAPASTSAASDAEGKLKKALKYPKRKAVDVKRSLSQSHLPTSSTTSLNSNPTSARPSSHHPSASTSSFVVPPAPGSVVSEPPTRIPSKLRKKSGDLRREKSGELKEKRSSGFARVLGRNKSVDVLSTSSKPEQKRQISQPILDFNPSHPSHPFHPSSSHLSSSRPSPPLGAGNRASVFSNTGLGEPWVERSSIDGPGVLGSPVSFSPSLPSLASPPRKLIPREARGSMSPGKRQSFTDTASVLSSPGMGRPGRQVSVKIVDAPGHEPVSMAEFFANDSDYSDSEDEAESTAREPRRQASQASISSKGSKGRMRRISSGFSKLNKSLHDLGGGSGGSGDREKDASLASRFNKSLHNLADNYIVKPDKSDRSERNERNRESRESSPPFALQPASVAGSSNSSLHPITPPRKGPRRSASLMTKFNKSLHDLADTLKPDEMPEYEGGAKVSRRHSYIPRLVRSLSRNPSHASTGSLSPAHSALVPPSPGESYSAQSSILLESEPSLQFEPLVEEPEPAEIAERAETEELIAKTGPPVSMVPTSLRTPDQKPVTTPSSPLHALPPASPRFSPSHHHAHVHAHVSPERTHDSLGIDFGVLLAEGRASTEVEIGHGADVPRPTVRRSRGYTLSKSDEPFTPQEVENELAELERLSGRVLSKEEARRSICSVAASERELLRLTTEDETSRPETVKPVQIAHAETLDQLLASQNPEKPKSSTPEPQAEPQPQLEREHQEKRQKLRRGTSLESNSVRSVELSTPAEEIVPTYEAHIPATIQEEAKQSQYSSVSPAFTQGLPSFDPISPLKMHALLDPEPVAFIQPLARAPPIATQPLVDDSQLDSSLEPGEMEDGEERKLKRESTFEDLAQQYVSAPEPNAESIEKKDEIAASFPSHTAEEHALLVDEETYDIETTFGDSSIDARASPGFPARSIVASPLPVPEEVAEFPAAQTEATALEAIEDTFVHELDEELEIAKLQEEEEQRLERIGSPATIEELPSPQFSMDEFATPAGIDFGASPAEDESEFATPTAVFETVLTRSIGGVDEYGEVHAEGTVDVEIPEEVETAEITVEGTEGSQPAEEESKSLFEGTSALEAAAVASVAVAAPIAAFAAVSPVPAPRTPEVEVASEPEPIVEAAELESVVQSSPAISKNNQLLKSAIAVPREVVQFLPAITKNTRLLKDAICVPRVVRQNGPGITKNTQLLKDAINVPRELVQFSPAIALLDQLLKAQICVPRQVSQCSAAIDWNTQLIMDQIAVPREVKQDGPGIEKNTQLLRDAIHVPREVAQTGSGIDENERLLHEAIEVPRDVPQTGAGIETNTALIRSAIAVPREVPQSGPGIERNTELLKHALHDIPAEERWNYHPVVQSSPAIEKNTAVLRNAINVPRQVVQFSPAIQMLNELLKAQICVPRQVPQGGPGIEKNEALLKHAILDVPMEERWNYHPVEQEGPGIDANAALLKQAIEVPRQVKQSGKGIDVNVALLKQAIEVPREVVQSSPGISRNTKLLLEAIAVPREVVQSSAGIETNTILLKQAIEVPRQVPQAGLGIELNKTLLRRAILAPPPEEEAEDAHSEASTPADELVTQPVELENSPAIELNESLLREAICKPAPASRSHSSSASAASSVHPGSPVASVVSVVPHSRSASQPSTPPSPVKSLIEKFEAAEVDALPLVAAEPPYSPPIEHMRTLSFEHPEPAQATEITDDADDEASVAGAEETESVRDDADIAVPVTSTDRSSTATSTSTGVSTSDLDASNADPCDGSQSQGEEPEATGAKEEEPEESEEGGSTEAPAVLSCAPGREPRLAPIAPATPATNEHEPPAETQPSFHLVNALLPSSVSATVPESSVPDAVDTDELTASAETDNEHDLDDNVVSGESFAAVASHPPSTDPSSHPLSTTSDMAASPVATATATATAPRADIVVEVNPATPAIPVVATPVPIVHATTAPVEQCHVDHARERQDALSAKAERIRAERAREGDELWPHECPPLRYASPAPAPAAAAATIVLPSITVQAPTPAQSLHHAPAPALTKNQKKKARQKAKRQAARAAMTDSDTSSVVSSHHAHANGKGKKKGVEVEAEGVKITVNADKEAKDRREREEREAREKKEKEEREAREEKEKEEREAREKEKEEREAHEKKEKEEREAKEKKEREEREAKEKREREEREAREKREREEREARENKEREEREAKGKREREEREAREKKEREIAAAEAKLAAERAAAEAAALKAAEEAKAAAEKAEREAREAKEAEEKAAAEKAAAEAAAEKERKEKEREERRRLRAEREDLLRQELEIRKRELERAQYAEQLMAQQAAHAGPWRPPMPYGVPPPGLGFAGLNLGLPPYAARFPAPHPMMGPLGPIFHHPPGGFMPPPPPGPGPRRF